MHTKRCRKIAFILDEGTVFRSEIGVFDVRCAKVHGLRANGAHVRDEVLPADALAPGQHYPIQKPAVVHRWWCQEADKRVVSGRESDLQKSVANRSQCCSQTLAAIDTASPGVVIHHMEIDHDDSGVKIATDHHRRCCGQQRSKQVNRARMKYTRQQTAHKRTEQFTRGQWEKNNQRSGYRKQQEPTPQLNAFTYSIDSRERHRFGVIGLSSAEQVRRE